MEVEAMATDERDILELLKEELDFIEKEDTDDQFVRRGKVNPPSRILFSASTMVTHIALTRATSATCSALSVRNTGPKMCPVTSYL